MKVIFVSSTDTGVGKTHVSGVLINSLADRGMRVMYLKPLESGFIYDSSDCKAMLDILNALRTDGEKLSLDDVNYRTFSRPCCIYEADKEFDLGLLRHYMNSRIRSLSADHDILLVEGAGGLFSPIKIDYFMIDLAREFCHSIVLVSGSSIGCINHMLLNYSALTHLGKSFFMFVNLLDPGFSSTSGRYLADFFRRFDHGKYSSSHEDLLNFVIRY